MTFITRMKKKEETEEKYYDGTHPQTYNIVYAVNMPFMTFPLKTTF